MAALQLVTKATAVEADRANLTSLENDGPAAKSTTPWPIEETQTMTDTAYQRRRGRKVQENEYFPARQQHAIEAHLTASTGSDC